MEREDGEFAPDLSVRDLMDEAVDGAVALIVSKAERNGLPADERKDDLGVELLRFVDERLRRLRKRRILLAWPNGCDAAGGYEAFALWRREEDLVALRSRAAALMQGDGEDKPDRDGS